MSRRSQVRKNTSARKISISIIAKVTVVIWVSSDENTIYTVHLKYRQKVSIKNLKQERQYYSLHLQSVDRGLRVERVDYSMR